VEFDASLTGIGIIWYMRDADGAERMVGGSAVTLLPFDFGEDSSYQNLAEFMAATLGLLGLLILGIEASCLCLRGDSVSALTWAHAERYRGSMNTNASLVYTLTAIRMGTRVEETIEIASKDNPLCDGLSRHESLETLSLEHVPHVDLEGSPGAMALLWACRPHRQVPFLQLWGEIRDALFTIPLVPHTDL
jgi:hypothetical protein